ncbi:hypothetical protein H8356DRAFT_1041798 [Neocallimastix lanati (nom. inval.)]|nr:hypothetical protein H8356DRAFT_1041798 [Neocallimastix sp. JGI-2020a]
MMSLKLLNYILCIILFFNNIFIKSEAKATFNNLICYLPQYPWNLYKDYIKSNSNYNNNNNNYNNNNNNNNYNNNNNNNNQTINNFYENYENDGDYGKTDFIKIKRFQKKININNHIVKNFKSNHQPVSKKFHIPHIGRNEKRNLLETFKSHNENENHLLNKRRLDNFILEDSLYFNQYFGSQLNTIEKYIYDVLVSQLKNVTLLSFIVDVDFNDDYSVKLKDIISIMERVFGAISMDHPDICRLNRGKDHYDSQNNINIYKSNSHNRLYYVNATTIRLNYEDEQSSGNRRIKKKRREIKERNKINIEEDNDDNDDNYLSKIQLQLCSSPKDNICNTYTINDINRMNGLIEKKIQDILSNAKLYFEKKKNQNNDSDDSNSSSSSSSNISNSNKDKTLSNNKDVKITEYEFIKYIHDLLIKNIEYGFSDNDFTEYTIYGALIEHRCVCEGFSEAFMILAQRVKIFTILATSNTHQWNMVFLEGKWYALDVTWDIPNYSSLSIINKHKEVGRLKKKRNTISSSDIQTNDDFDIENKKLFDKVNVSFFLIGNKTVIKERNNDIFQNEPNHQLCNYIIYPYAFGFRYPTLDDNKYNIESKYKKHIHIHIK